MLLYCTNKKQTTYANTDSSYEKLSVELEFLYQMDCLLAKDTENSLRKYLIVYFFGIPQHLTYHAGSLSLCRTVRNNTEYPVENYRPICNGNDRTWKISLGMSFADLLIYRQGFNHLERIQTLQVVKCMLCSDSDNQLVKN